MVYRSPLPRVPTRLRAAAIYCSDGRFGEHCDDFLQYGLGLPHYDRIALPGGSACLVDHPAASVERSAVLSELRFLVDAHELERVVLIAHQGCGLYQAHYGLPDDQLEAKQRPDLVTAAGAIRQLTGVKRVEAWFLRVDGDDVSFEPVPVD